MATESNQTAGATGPAAPPATPSRNRHSAGIQVDGLGLPTHIPAGNVFVMSRRCGKTRLVERWLEVSPSEAAVRTFQAALQAALVYGHVDDWGLPTYTSCNEWPPMLLRHGQPILTVKGDDGVTWDWRGMQEAR